MSVTVRPVEARVGASLEEIAWAERTCPGSIEDRSPAETFPPRSASGR
jgi:hypothetical protein